MTVGGIGSDAAQVCGGGAALRRGVRQRTYPRTPEGRRLAADLGHFFGAWRIDAFRPAEEFRAAMDDLQRLLKNAPKAAGRERIYIAGEKEQEALERNLAEGDPAGRRGGRRSGRAGARTWAMT